MPRDNTASKHIAVLAFPFATHAAPLLSLIRRLSAAAPVAKFSFFSTAQSNSMISNENERCEAIKHYNVADGTPENYVFSGNPGEPVENFIKATPGNFKTAMAEVLKDTGKGFSCIITDAFFWFAADMVAELHVPWVAVWTAGPLPVLLHIETDLIREKLGIEELGFNGKFC
ncbi:hypothetical protein JCGZ_23020 [Jatropha curcas]|uniref:Anthocyanidin 3-O-glucosyltransferase n=1 Tax=Jatropha curcas TaxID=180498 RepID=A0A067L5Y6_JATCU|nr:hypothetical protein JCGZ_23020 [Jatropha curcas]